MDTKRSTRAADQLLDQRAVRRLVLSTRPPLRNPLVPGITGAVIGVLGAPVVGAPIVLGAIGSHVFWIRAVRDKAQATAVYFTEGDFAGGVRSGLQLHSFVSVKSPRSLHILPALQILSASWQLAILSQRPELVNQVSRAFRIHYFPPRDPNPPTERIEQSLEQLVQALAAKHPMDGAAIAREGAAFFGSWASATIDGRQSARLIDASENWVAWSNELETYARQLANQLSHPYTDEELSFYLQEHRITPSVIPYLGNSDALAGVLNGISSPERDHLLRQLPDLAAEFASQPRIDLQHFALKIRRVLFEIADPQDPSQILPAADNLLGSYMQLQLVPQALRLRAEMKEIVAYLPPQPSRKIEMATERSFGRRTK